MGFGQACFYGWVVGLFLGKIEGLGIFSGVQIVGKNYLLDDEYHKAYCCLYCAQYEKIRLIKLTMKFVVISDTHGKHRDLKLPEGDAIIHSGDFCHYGSNDDMNDFLKWYKELEFETKILIGGNHDFFAAEQSELFKEKLPKEVIYLNDSGVMIKGIKIWGSPVQPDLVGWAFGKERGKEMKIHWDLIPADTEILITHTPPYGILDKSRSGKSIGCEELSKRLEKLQIKFHVFGHVHASYGEKQNEKTKYINASNINSSRGLVNQPITFEFER